MPALFKKSKRSAAGPFRVRYWLLAGAVLVLGTSRALAPRTGEERAIEVLLSADTNIYATGLVAMQSTVEAPLRINYLDSLLAEHGDASRYFRELEASRPPLVLTIGPGATRMALEHLERTPVLFSMVQSARAFAPASGRTCGVSMEISIGEYFRTLKEIAPEARRVHAFYSTPDNEHIAGEGEYLDLRYGLYYRHTRVRGRERLGSALKKIAGETDAVYMIADPLYDRARFEELSRFCKERSIVLMTGFAALVRAGATFGITPDYGRIGVQTGEMANRILSGGSTCRDEGVVFVDQTSFYLNESYARQSGLAVPEPIKERARLTRLFNAGVNFLNNGKLKSARIVFDAILARDPGNGPASGYRRLVIEQQTGARTGRLMRSARDSLKKENYDAALRDFQRVTEINPNHEAAVRGYRQALLARSERDRLRGQALERSGRPFAAIKMFQVALRGYPGNDRAGRDLARVRAAQGARVPELTREGIALYGRREYAAAIEIFENILLVRPGHKQATEYLRLSRKKRAAIQKLLQRSEG